MVNKNKKKKVVIDDEEIDLDDLIEEELPPDVAKIAEELGSGNFKVIVQKFTDNGKIEKIGDFIPDEFNADLIAKEYGGGKFKFTIRDEKGKYVKQSVTTYAKPLIKQIDTPKEQPQSKIVDLLQEQLKATKDEQKATNVAMIEMMGKVLEAQMSAGKSNGNTDLDNLIKIANLLSANKNVNPMENITSVMNMLKEGIDIGKMTSMLQGDNKPEDILLMKLAEQVLPLFQRLKNPQTIQPIQPIPQPPNKIIEQKEPVKMEYKTENERAVIETLKNNSDSLIGCAKNSMDYPTVSSLIESKLSETDVDKILDYFDSDRSAENIQRTFIFIPEFKPYESWFIGLLNNLMERFTIEPEVPENDGDKEKIEVK